jgi:hypothetical protein
MILSWRENSTSLYVDGEYQTSADFYHGHNKFHISDGELPTHEPSNSLVLYSLSSGSTSEFKGLQVCEFRCPGGENLIHKYVNEHDFDPDDMLAREL